MRSPEQCAAQLQQSAARNQRLGSDTYQRLASFVAIGFGAAAVYAAASLGGLGIVWHDEALVKRWA